LAALHVGSFHTGGASDGHRSRPATSTGFASSSSTSWDQCVSSQSYSPASPELFTNRPQRALRPNASAIRLPGDRPPELDVLFACAHSHARRCSARPPTSPDEVPVSKGSAIASSVPSSPSDTPSRAAAEAAAPRICASTIRTHRSTPRTARRRRLGRWPSARPPGRRPTRPLGPGPGSVPCSDQVTVPAQHRVRAYQQPHPTQRLRLQPVQQRRQQGPIRQREPDRPAVSRRRSPGSGAPDVMALICTDGVFGTPSATPA
jgi:hypothetical protein